jgi:hypothetical protein
VQPTTCLQAIFLSQLKPTSSSDRWREISELSGNRTEIM